MPLEKTLPSGIGIFQYKKNKFKRRRTGNDPPKPAKAGSDSEQDEDDDDQDVQVIEEKRGRRGRPRKNEASSIKASQSLQEVKKLLDSDSDDDIEVLESGSKRDVKAKVKAAKPLKTTEEDPDDLGDYVEPAPCRRAQSDITKKITQLQSKLRSVGSSFEKNSRSSDVLRDEDLLADDRDKAAGSSLAGQIDRVKIVVGLKLGDDVKKFKIFADGMMEKNFMEYVNYLHHPGKFVQAGKPVPVHPPWAKTVRLEELVFTIARTGLEATRINTPNRLGIEHNDIIDVERREDVERRKKEEELNSVSFEDDEEAGGEAQDDSRYCTLVVKLSENDKKAFKIQKTDPLEKLFKAFAKHKQKDVSDFKFMFDGLVVQPQATVESLELEDDDMIEASLLKS